MGIMKLLTIIGYIYLTIAGLFLGIASLVMMFLITKEAYRFLMESI